MTLEEFIENHIRVAPKGEHIKLTPVQYAFLDWNKKYKKKTSDMETLKNGDIVNVFDEIVGNYNPDDLSCELNYFDNH